VIWEKDRRRFICKVEAYNASYSTKYFLVKHLRQKHDISMEPKKPEHWSTQQKGLQWQDPCIHWCMVLCLKGMCHTWVGSITKWCTTNKINIETYTGKIGFFQVACSLGHSHVGCGPSPPMWWPNKKRTMILLIEFELTRSPTQRNLKMNGIIRIERDLQAKRNMRKRSP
jgi:hypothetical protein